MRTKSPGAFAVCLLCLERMGRVGTEPDWKHTLDTQTLGTLFFERGEKEVALSVFWMRSLTPPPEAIKALDFPSLSSVTLLKSLRLLHYGKS